MELSYCVTNTNARDATLACVEAIKRARPDGLEQEIVVLDNASQDGSADALRADPEVRVIARDRRAGVAENRTILLREANGELCLLLDEDVELQPGSVEALVEALQADPDAAVAGPQLIDPDGAESPCAWRLPGVGTALAQLLFLGGPLVTQSGGTETRAVGWVQSAAMLARRDALEAIGWYDPSFFLYSDETDLQKRLRDSGHRNLHVPTARAIHHEQLSTDDAGTARRIVQFHRGRDLYMRKHHSTPAVLLTRLLWSLSYIPRAIAAAFIPSRSPRRYWLHARQALLPRSGGEGMAEAAEAFNRRLASEQAAA
jgi:N-acetylglucosaminyl-diphospho-decaprenol L-rhamnosyltransferase